MTSPSEFESSHAVLAGQGSMGRVYRVNSDAYNALAVPELRASDWCAVKVLERPSLRQRFVDEFNTLRRLSSHVFVEAHRLGMLRDEHRLTSQLEWCEGIPIRDLAEQQGQDVEHLAAELFRGLDHLHRHGLVHGDLSPDNILFERHSETPVKILDLGASGETGSGAGLTSGQLTFTAPERLAGDPLAPTADLWACGAVIFFYLHGCHPFPDYPRDVDLSTGPITRGLKQTPLDVLLTRLLSADPSARYQSAGQALEALEALTTTRTPLINPARLVNRFERAPLQDTSALLPVFKARFIQAVDTFKGEVIDLVGAPGSGKSRFLDELGSMAASIGIRPLHIRLRPEESASDVMTALLSRLNGPHSPESHERVETMALARRVVSALRAQTQPHLVLVDDADQGTSEAQRAVQLIEQAIIQPAPMSHPMLMVCARCDHIRDITNLTLAPWDVDDIIHYFTDLFPGRRVSERLKKEASEYSLGLPKRLRQWCIEAARQGALRISATTIALDESITLSPLLPEPSMEIAGVGTLEPAQNTLVTLVSHARRPIPMRLFEEERANLSSLVSAGILALVIHEEELHVCLTTSARSEPPSPDKFRELATRWEASAKGDPQPYRALFEALFYRIQCREEDAVGRARELVLRHPSRHAGPLLRLIVDEAWPRTTQDCHRVAALAMPTRDPELGIMLLERSLTLETGADSQGETLVALGRHEAEEARHANAIRFFERALDTSTSPEFSTLDANIALARSLTLIGELDRAQHHCARALRQLPRSDAKRCGRALYAAGLLAWYRGDLKAAEENLTDALGYVRQTADQRELAAVVTAIGLVAHRRGELEYAAQCYERALTLGEQAGDATRILTSLQNIAVAAHQSGDITRALATYHEAYAMAKALLQTGRVIQLAANQGKLWRYLGQYDAARSLLEQGLELSRSEGNTYLMTLCSLALAEVCLEQDDLDSANGLLETCLEHSGVVEGRVEVIEAMLALSEVKRRQGDLNAIMWAERGRDLAEASEQYALIARSCGALTECLRTLKPDAYQAASTSLAAGLAKLDAIQNPEYRVAILFQAASLAKDGGDHEGLTFAFNLMRALMQQLLDSIPARYRVAFTERRQIAKIRQFIMQTAEEVEMPNTPRASVDEQERWNRLLAVTKQLASERDIEKLLRFIMDSAVVLCGAERGFLVLVAPEAPEGLSVRVARNIDQEDIRRTRLKISIGIARRVITEQESVLTIDAMEDERYREQVSVHDLKLRSVLCLPMVVRGESVGAIYLDNRFRRSVFTNDDVEQMQAFADQAALALDNAQLLQQMEQTRAELVESQREILSLNEQLQEQLAAQTLELETTQRVLMEQQRQLGVKHQYSNIVGSSDSMKAVFRIIDRLLDNAVPVLIEGESGTGKELVARAIHFNGNRRDEPFVAVNCAAIPTHLIESELFGHVRGAFTGATADRQGLFETADKGTLLLDELGELPLEMQVKLLRVLQSGEVQKVGSSHSRSVDVRIIAATNRRLKDEIEQGRFREDLYYRLAVIPITLPPLRARRDDIPLLAAHFMTQHHAQGIGEATEIEAQAFKRLMRYDWPGNIRQLEMVLKNAALFCDGHKLSLPDFNAFPEIMNAGVAPSKEHSLSGLSLAEIEKAAIRQALKDTKGNKKRAAEQLGIDRRTLYNKLAAYQIVIERQLKVR